MNNWARFGEFDFPSGEVEPDHYKVLGVRPAATRDEIRAAYRARVVRLHPDKGGDPARFQECQAAFETLYDDQARAAYDNRASRGAVGAYKINVPISALYAESAHVVPYQRDSGGIGSLSIRVPAGAADKMRLVTEVDDARDGRVVAVVHHIQSTDYKVADRDVCMTLTLTLDQILCAHPIRVTRPDGRVLHVAAGEGTVLTPATLWELPGHGLPACGSYHEGALLLSVSVHYPMVLAPAKARAIASALGVEPPSAREDTISPVASARRPGRAGGEPPCAVQ